MSAVTAERPTLARQSLSVHAAERDAAQVLFELAHNARLAGGWHSWRFDRDPSGTMTASFDVSPHAAGGLRRRAMGLCRTGLVVHLPHAISRQHGPADVLASVLEQAGSDFSLHVIRHVGDDAQRRESICTLLARLASYACGVDERDLDAFAGIDHRVDADQVDELFDQLANDPLVGAPLGVYLLTLARAVEAVRIELDDEHVREIVARHVAAARRRLGSGVAGRARCRDDAGS